MKTEVGRTVHPWYKGRHEWTVKGIAKLRQPIQYDDSLQGNVSYDPRILLLESEKQSKALWFTYWISTKRTGGRMKWGQGSPMLEESSLLSLLKQGVKQGFFTNDFLRELGRELGEGSGE